MYRIGPGRDAKGNQILEFVGLTCRNSSRMPDPSNWNTPTLAAREHLVGLPVLERDRIRCRHVAS